MCSKYMHNFLVNSCLGPNIIIILIHSLDGTVYEVQGYNLVTDTLIFHLVISFFMWLANDEKP